MTTKQYTIDGRAFRQARLSLRRGQRLAALVASMGLDGLRSGLPSVALQALIDKLTSAELPAEFFRIVLDGPVDDVADWGEIDLDTAVEVVADFFELNSKTALRLIDSLRALLPSAGPILRASSMTSSPESTTSQTLTT